MKTIAQQIEETTKDTNIAINLAEAQNPYINQNWKDEATIFRFNDNSHLVISGPYIKAYKNSKKVLIDFPNSN